MIRIFGAGPAGSAVAYELAQAGYDVTLYEEHSEIGSPIQCTGILTNAVDDVLQVPKNVVDFKIEHVRVHAPDGNILKVRFHKPNLIVCRTKFDQWLADRAQKAGVTIETGVKLLEAGERLKVRTAQGITYLKHGITIGADGPQSRVSKHLNPHVKREYYGGLQVTAERENDGAIEFHPYIKDIAWATPENTERMRIGVMSRGNTKQQFDTIRKLYPGKELARQAGTIPLYNSKLKLSKNGFYTIGDAAGMVKATTGGGIVQSLKAAPLLAQCITQNKDWNVTWKQKQSFDLRLHNMLRKRLDTFSDDNWNDLIKRARSNRVQRVLSTVPRDDLTAMLPRLAIAKPSLALNFFGL